MSDQIQNIRIKYVVDSAELQKVPEVLDVTKKKFDDVNNSIKNQVKSLDTLRQEYTDLKKARDSATDTVEIKKYNDQLKEAEKNIKDLEKATHKLEDNTKKAKEEIKDFARNMSVFGVNAGDAFDKLDGGIGKTVKGLSALKLAFIGTGIGAFLVVIGSLVAYFKSTELGAEKLERGLAAVGAVVKVIVGRAAELGKAIIDAVSSPKKLIADFGEFIKQNLINRFTAFGVILKAITEGDLKGFSNGVIQAATGVENASGKFDKLKTGVKNLGTELSATAKAAMDMEGTLQDIEDAENNLQLTIAKSINKRQELAILAKRAGEDSKEGIALIQQAVQIEKNIVDQQIALQIRKVAALKVLNDQALKNGEVDRGNELEEYRQAQVQLENLKGNSLEVIAKLENRAASLGLKGAKEAAKERQALEKSITKFLSDEYTERQRNIDSQFKAEIDSEEKIVEEKEEIQTDAEHKLSVDAQRAQAEIDAKRKQDVIDTKKAEAEKSQIQASAINTASQLLNISFELQKNASDQALNDLETKKAYELKLAGDNAQQKAVIEAKYAAEEKKIKTKQAQNDKEQAIFNIVISTAQAIAKASPVIPLMALAGALGAAQLAVVASRPIPKFNKGTKSVPGVDLGDDSVLAMVRPTEKIFPVGTSRQYEPALDAIFDHKVPASLINSFALDYDRIGRVAVSSGGGSSNGLEKKLDKIDKTLSNMKVAEINIDKKGMRTFVKQSKSQTEFVNNYFKN